MFASAGDLEWKANKSCAIGVSNRRRLEIVIADSKSNEQASSKTASLSPLFFLYLRAYSYFLSQYVLWLMAE